MFATNESLNSTPETNTTLYVNLNLNKVLKQKKKERKKEMQV